MYPKRERANHLASRKGKSHPRAIAVRYSLQMVLGMKTDTSRRAAKEVELYGQLQQQIHEALRRQHPEWVQANGESPMCDAYDTRFAKLLGVPFPREQRVAA